MNFLAHLHLAEPDGIAPPAELVGALMPDLVRGPLPADLPGIVTAQVERHRRIDRATDVHPAFLEALALFRPTLGRLAGIAVDVSFDAALCRTWARWHPDPLDLAVRRYEVGLFAGRAHMPPRMREACRRMIAQGWLGRYASHAGLAATFAQMSEHFSRRLGRPIDLRPAAGLAREHADGLDRWLEPLLTELRRPRVLLGVEAGSLSTPHASGPGDPAS